MLIGDLPPNFVQALYERIGIIYPDSYNAMLNDPTLGKEEAHGTLGFYRRAQAETVFMNTAVEYGLRFRYVQPKNGGCKHIRVTAGKFGLALCHVVSPGGFPSYSDVREQSSKINEYISQMNLFPVKVKPEENEKFYGIFVHTEKMGRKDQFQSMHIGFPNPEFDDWVEEPIDVLEIIDIQHRLFRKQGSSEIQIQKAVPVLKKNDSKSDQEN